MMKPYFQREKNINLLSLESSLIKEEDEEIPKLELGIKYTELSDIWMNIQSNTRLTAEQKEKLSQLIKGYSRTFSTEPGCTNLTEHDIELESDRPILEAPGKEAKPCIDYQRLNKITRTKFFPLPNIEESTEKVLAAKYVSVLDLTRGYWQIPLSKNAQRNAAFVTNFGTFKPLRLPFGLKNAPYDFSRLMASILKDCEEYASCKIAQAYVKYLGHLVGQGLRTPGELKVQVIKDFPIPTNKTQVRAFLGLAGYYRRYIPEFSVIAAPLTDLLKGRNRESTFDWNSSCQNAFEELKTRLSKNPVLYSLDFTKPFIIQCDASNLGIGIVLLQVCENEEHPIMFLSKKLSLAEQKYSTTEKECAAIIFALQKLKC
ncbi:retrovirus-related Pol polyprotein from transposon 297 [Trichonephila inaurata madagascariensis]|uniref:RNA-directed DNA polymerase n=1 Tax=Trichonephila inaurata madagascariensis TaxID=2747483 RepID=A0A8X7CTV2_9ARAC|nr:retrovirus-related Pol polyprotein from transposon 297 [Trichonephila inaurata madagascariensis]